MQYPTYNSSNASAYPPQQPGSQASFVGQQACSLPTMANASSQPGFHPQQQQQQPPQSKDASPLLTVPSNVQVRSASTEDISKIAKPQPTPAVNSTSQHPSRHHHAHHNNHHLNAQPQQQQQQQHHHHHHHHHGSKSSGQSVSTSSSSLTASQASVAANFLVQPKKEIVFPADSVEATMPTEAKKRKITARDIGKLLFLSS